MFKELAQEDQFFLIGRLTTIAESNHENTGQRKMVNNHVESKGGKVISLETIRKHIFV